MISCTPSTACRSARFRSHCRLCCNSEGEITSNNTRGSLPQRIVASGMRAVSRCSYCGAAPLPTSDLHSGWLRRRLPISRARLPRMTPCSGDGAACATIGAAHELIPPGVTEFGLVGPQERVGVEERAVACRCVHTATLSRPGLIRHDPPDRLILPPSPVHAHGETCAHGAAPRQSGPWSPSTGRCSTSAFGARRAVSMATAYGCAGTSSGSTSIGVWQPRTKSRVTVKTKSGLERYILFRNASTIAIVMSGRRAHSAGPQPLMLFW